MNLWTVSMSDHFPPSGMTAVSLSNLETSLNTDLSNYTLSLGYMQDKGHGKLWVDNAEPESIQGKSNLSNKALRNSM